MAAPRLFKAQEFNFESLGIGGLDQQFDQIFRRAFASRVFPPSMVERLGIRHVKGVLLFGPPGTGEYHFRASLQCSRMLQARLKRNVSAYMQRKDFRVKQPFVGHFGGIKYPLVMSRCISEIVLNHSKLPAGKTLIARQIGKMLNGKEPKIVNGPEILNKYVGASEENVRNLFKVCFLESPYVLNAFHIGVAW